MARDSQTASRYLPREPSQPSQPAPAAALGDSPSRHNDGGVTARSEAPDPLQTGIVTAVTAQNQGPPGEVLDPPNFRPEVCPKKDTRAMTARELLEDLDRREVRLTVRDDRLRIEGPRRLLTEELRCLLSERKPELLDVIRRRSGGSEAGAESERIAAMPLDEFAQAGLAVHVWSGILRCEVTFASDDAPDDAIEGTTDLPVYRAAELRKLAILRPRPRHLRKIHDLKTIFGGSITDVRAREDQRPQRTHSTAKGRQNIEHPAVALHSQ